MFNPDHDGLDSRYAKFESNDWKAVREEMVRQICSERKLNSTGNDYITLYFL